jgi:ATP-dependent DNA helicase RecG
MAEAPARDRQRDRSRNHADTIPESGAAQRKASAPGRALERLGLTRDIDLALHLPLRYEDETHIVRIVDAREGDTVQVEGTVADARVEFRPRRQLVVRLDDGGDTLVLRFLNFYPSHQKTLTRGARVRVRGELRGGFLGREMVHPSFKAVQPGAALATALTPVYPTVAQLPQTYLRKAIASALTRAPLHEVLPPGTVPAGLPTLRDALMSLHQPPADASTAGLQDHAHPAWQRLKFEELLAQQLSQHEARRERAALRAPELRGARDGLHERLLAVLPFELTTAQRRVSEEIATDLAQPRPMHRLLQGDVGSGKTVVAALAAAIAIDAGWQCALMAPTEILAEQHFRKLVSWLEPLGIGIAWLTGSRKGRARTQMVARVASGEARLVIGTHAVIQDDVRFARLGLAIIDEQHRFGVQQRLALRRKLVDQSVPATARGPGGVGAGVMADHEGGPPAKQEPHLLMMSATPIPRTLAMSYFADLDVSTIDELPPGRQPVLTKVFADARRDEVVARIRDEIDKGRQVYWVCPLIDESDSATGAAAQAHAGVAGVQGRSPGRSQKLDLQNATETHRQLCAALPERLVGLLHGRMPASEKAAVMSLFTGGQMQVLVATTVIEVGVDVPNASLMVIEHAERFGLAQLHQLRGRIGRGSTASVCVLLYSAPLSPTAKERLRAIVDTHDGFEIARRDLEIRGPGEFMGARQSGDALLRFADLAEDAPLLQSARAAAPRLLRDHAQAARAHVERWLGGKAEYFKA